jgi:flavodoxin
VKALIVYESMYGNTRAVAEAVAAGLRPAAKTEVCRISEVTHQAVAEADLLVVGAPTHVHGLSRSSTRKAAAEAAEKSEGKLTLEPDARYAGVREWLGGLRSLGDGHGKSAAAFDTRLSAPPMFTGRAGTRIAKRLRKIGYAPVGETESFLVDKENRLLDGETDRAEAWGRELAEALAATGGEANG